MPTARPLGNRDDLRNLDGSDHRSRHKTDPYTWTQFDRCLSCARMDDPGGVATHARLSGCCDGDFDRSWGRALFRRGRVSRLAGTAIPQRNMARLRAGRGQLSLRGRSAWRGVGTIVRSRGIFFGCLFREPCQLSFPSIGKRVHDQLTWTAAALGIHPS
jgi:hypothetical protein